MRAESPVPDPSLLRLLVHQATEAATPSLTALAREANVSDASLSSWRRGVRVPTSESLEMLAAALLDQAASLEYWARRLERLARRAHEV